MDSELPCAAGSAQTRALVHVPEFNFGVKIVSSKAPLEDRTAEAFPSAE